MRCIRLAIVLVLATAAPASAQLPSALGFEAVFGIGRGGGGEYRDHERTTWRIGIHGRLVRISPASLIASVERDRVFMGGDRIDICAPAPRGGCLTEFPEFVGWVGSSGLRVPVGRVTVMALAGDRATSHDVGLCTQ
jgi:hypothetical protein